METEEILRKLDMIFRDILKNENITLTHYNIRFGLREILKFKHVGDLCASIQAKKK